MKVSKHVTPFQLLIQQQQHQELESGLLVTLYGRLAST